MSREADGGRLGAIMLHVTGSRPVRWLVACASLLLTAGCADFLGLDDTQERQDILVLLGTDRPALFDIRTGDLRRVGEKLANGGLYGYVEHTGEQALYGVGRQGPDDVLMRFDLRDFTVRRVLAETISRESGFERFSPSLGEIALTPPGNGLLIRVYLPDTDRFGLIELSLDLTFRRFVPTPYAPTELALLPSSPTHPEGVVAILGSPQHDPHGPPVLPAEGHLTFLDWPSLEVRDSVVFDHDPHSVIGGVVRLRSDPQGEKAFVQGTDRIYAVDLETLEKESSAARVDPWRYMLQVSDDGEALFLTDDGTLYQDGEGLLHVMSRDLVLQEPIDLTGAERPVNMWYDLISIGDTVVVQSATGRFPGQKQAYRSEILVASRSAGRLLESYPLDYWYLTMLRPMS